MANKVYWADEAEVDWADSGGDEVMTFASLASGAGRQGALHDFGAPSISRHYKWRFWCKFATAPVVGEAIEVYWKTADETGSGAEHPDNDDGAGDAPVSSEDKLRNLRFLGALIVDEAATGVEMVANGEFEFSERHGGPVLWNRTADALSATAADMGFRVTPIPDEVQ